MRRGWARLADERAAELLGAAVELPALVVARPDGFGCPADRGVVVAVAPGGERPGVSCVAAELPFATATFASVVDTTRPEDPGDHEPLVRELLRVCRPGGVVAAVACGGAAATVGPRTLPLLTDCLTVGGAEIERLVPFDALGTFSPWRLALGARRDRVLAELEAHLGHPAVREATRLLEEVVVSTLPPEQVGRVFLLARRSIGRAEARRGASVVPPGAGLARPDVGPVALRLLQDDTVIRFAAFLDAELLAPAGTGFDVLRWLEELGAAPGGELRPRLWRWPGLEAYRFLGAASHRLARRTLAALTEGDPDAGVLATLEYDLVAAMNALLESDDGEGDDGEARWSG
jgi:SAM-dependent methyltransferase